MDEALLLLQLVTATDVRLVHRLTVKIERVMIFRKFHRQPMRRTVMKLKRQTDTRHVELIADENITVKEHVMILRRQVITVILQTAMMMVIEDDATTMEINVDAEMKIQQMTAMEIVTETDAKQELEVNHDLRHEPESMEEMKTENHLQANLVTEFLDKEE